MTESVFVNQVLAGAALLAACVLGFILGRMWFTRSYEQGKVHPDVYREGMSNPVITFISMMILLAFGLWLLGELIDWIGELFF